VGLWSRISCDWTPPDFVRMGPPDFGLVLAESGHYSLYKRCLPNIHKTCFLQSRNVVLAEKGARHFYHSMRPRHMVPLLETPRASLRAWT